MHLDTYGPSWGDWRRREAGLPAEGAAWDTGCLRRCCRPGSTPPGGPGSSGPRTPPASAGGGSPGSLPGSPESIHNKILDLNQGEEKRGSKRELYTSDIFLIFLRFRMFRCFCIFWSIFCVQKLLLQLLWLLYVLQPRWVCCSVEGLNASVCVS